MEAILLTADKTAKFLGISPRTLWSLTKEKAIPVIRIGRRVLYAMDDILKFIERNRTGGESQLMTMGVAH